MVPMSPPPADQLLAAVTFDADGLVPVIAQEARTGMIRMMAWANRDALAQTLATGAAHFWSRSRRAAWRKGESSGNTLAVRDVRIDCDGDVVLYVVDAGRPVVPHRRHVVFLPPRRRRRRAGGRRRPRRSAVGHDRARRRRDRQAAPRAPRKVVRRVAAGRGLRQDRRQDRRGGGRAGGGAARRRQAPTPRTRRPTCCSTCWSAWKPRACRWTTSPPSCGAGSAHRGSTRRRAATSPSHDAASCTRSWVRAARRRRCCRATNRAPASSRWPNASPRAIDRDERLFVEAGTGTGKTLAYLVPALLSGRKVVVSTGTKTLQDQIATVDLPRLRSIFERAGVLPGPLNWAVMKGLSQLRLPAPAARARPAALAASPTPIWTGCSRSRESSPTGDRAELSDLPDDSPVWGEVAATPETRIGPRCAYFERCFVTNMRRRAAAAPLVIVNHHLFFADLALRARWPEAQVLPPYEAVIFDEAHQIEDVATEFFGVHASTQRLFALGRDLGRETGADAGARAGDRRAPGRRHRRVRRGAARASCRPAPGHRRDAGAVAAATSRRPPALARYHDLDERLEDIATWLDPDGDAVSRSQRPRRARRARAPGDGAAHRPVAAGRRPRPRARALAGGVGAQRRPARVADRRRAACWARARRLPGTDRSSPRRR